MVRMSVAEKVSVCASKRMSAGAIVRVSVRLSEYDGWRVVSAPFTLTQRTTHNLTWRVRGSGTSLRLPVASALF